MIPIEYRLDKISLAAKELKNQYPERKTGTGVLLRCIKNCKESSDFKIGNYIDGAFGFNPKYFDFICTKQEFLSYAGEQK